MAALLSLPPALPVNLVLIHTNDRGGLRYSHYTGRHRNFTIDAEPGWDMDAEEVEWMRYNPQDFCVANGLVIECFQNDQ